MDKNCTLKVDRPVYENEELHRTYGYYKPASTVLGRVKNCYREWKFLHFLQNLIPITQWLPHYKWRNDFVGDLISGITVAVMHIPQGMAYALLGAVPPIVGIYMAFFPILAYSLLGTSRHNSMGTFAVVCLMTGKSVTAYSPKLTDVNVTSTEDISYSPMEVATTVAFMVGIYQLVMYVFRMGIVCTLLSDTLVNGFTTGAAIHVFTSQVKDLLGLKITKHEGPFNIGFTYIEIFNKIEEVNLAVLVVSSITIVLLVINNEFLKPFVRKRSVIPIPIELIAVVTGTLISTYLNLQDKYEIEPVGDIPTGLPYPTLPAFSLLPKIFIDSFTITMVAYTIAMSMALIFAQKHNYEVDSNQELFAQGTSNIVGSFFSCMPITASLSRSLVQETVGGKTQLTSFISCLILLAVMLWIGPFFEPLPRCILASIIIVALKGMLLQAKDLPSFWRLSKLDGLVWIITFLTVVLVDIDYGLLVGLGLSLASILVQSMKPYTCLLGVMPNIDLYLDCTRYTQAHEVIGIKIFHYCGGLNFATRSHFKTELYRLVGINPQKELAHREKLERRSRTSSRVDGRPDEAREGIVNISFVEHGEDSEHVPTVNTPIKPQVSSYGSFTDEKFQIQYIILDFSALSYIDPSGVAALKLLNKVFNKLDITIYLAGISDPVYEKLQKCDLFLDTSNSFKTFPTVHDAVTFAQCNMNRSASIRV
ncbi:solute carrier family 26 member 10 isoform X2 [Zootermopsis nevadensis]|nr:solute carrier family 26 member 10 isoform X2 [Zootermopsis nevadensis]